MPFKLGVPELIIILVIIIAIFGAGKLAGLGGALGKGVKEFRDATKPDESAANKQEEGKKAGEAAQPKASDDQPKA